jgi:mannose-1-phosphate guanylyltransferase
MVADGAQVAGAVLFDGARIGAGAMVNSSVVGRGACIGAGAQLDGVVIGDGARIAEGNELRHGLRVWPEVELGPTAIRFSTDT